MPPVEGCDRCCAKALGGGDHRRVNGAESKIGVRPDQLGHPAEIVSLERIQLERRTRQLTEELRLGDRPKLLADEVGGFGQDELRQQQRLGVCLEEGGTARMVRIGLNGRRDERAGVDDNYLPNPSSSPSSSCRSNSATLNAPGTPLNIPMNGSDRPGAAGTCRRSKSAARSSAEVPRSAASEARRSATSSGTVTRSSVMLEG